MFSSSGSSRTVSLEAGGRPSDRSSRAMTITAGLQRIMQALGAFGFLGLVKGKAEFLAHIPAGVDHLQQLLVELAAVQSRPSAAVAAHLPPPLANLTRLVAGLAAPGNGG